MSSRTSALVEKPIRLPRDQSIGFPCNRAGWMRTRETVHLALGADADRTARFFACGMLGNTLTAIGLPRGAGK